MSRWTGFSFPRIAFLLLSQVLLYNGEFDLDCNIVGTLAWLSAVPWRGAAAFAAAPRAQWFAAGSDVTSEGGVGSAKTPIKTAAAHPAGYVKTTGTLTQLTLAGAGHMVPMNVPEVALAMINTLVDGRPFV